MTPKYNEFSAMAYNELFSMENRGFQCNSFSIFILTLPQNQLQQKTQSSVCFFNPKHKVVKNFCYEETKSLQDKNAIFLCYH